MLELVFVMAATKNAFEKILLVKSVRGAPSIADSLQPACGVEVADMLQALQGSLNAQTFKCRHIEIGDDG